MQIRSFFIVLSSLVLGACALSPQQVTVNPTLESSTRSDIGEGRTIYVEVVDARSERVVGTRGGLYKATSVITVGNDMESAIRTTAEQRFRQMGYVVQATPGASTDVRILVDTLSYSDPDTSKVGFEVELVGALRVEARQQLDTYNGRYQVKNHKTYATVPGREANERLINEVLSGALQRLFEDPKLLAFTLR